MLTYEVKGLSFIKGKILQRWFYPNRTAPITNRISALQAVSDVSQSLLCLLVTQNDKRKLCCRPQTHSCFFLQMAQQRTKFPVTKEFLLNYIFQRTLRNFWVWHDADKNYSTIYGMLLSNVYECVHTHTQTQCLRVILLILETENRFNLRYLWHYSLPDSWYHTSA